MLMPLRCTIMKILIHHKKGMTPAEIYELVDHGYKNEKQCTPQKLDDHLMSMKGVGIVEAIDAFEDEKKNTTVCYAFTEYGLETAKKYFPTLLD